MFRFACLSVLVALLIIPSILSAAAPPTSGPSIATPPVLQGVHRVVFVGDSITQAGDYVVDFECWCVAHDLNVEIINAGLASETATELTPEENADHLKRYGFPRPWIGERLARTLAVTKPDLLIACYGMNDATSLSADDAGLNRFKDAMTKLRQSALDAGAKHVLLCTPTVYGKDKSATETKPEQNLLMYTRWLLSQREAGWDIADLHTPMRKVLDDRRNAEPSFTFAKDGIHPNREGHWLMAQALLHDGFGADVQSVPADESLFSKNGKAIRDLIRQRHDLLFKAYMSKIGHKRPGVAGGPKSALGLSIADATSKAAQITTQIAALVR